MRGYIILKHGLKRLAGGLAVVSCRLGCGLADGGIVVLMYHRVAETGCHDFSVDDWNVGPRQFERQIAWLARNAECLSLAQLSTRLREPAGDRPRVLVTFDDGFGNFYTDALPVLRRYQVPAAVFLVTCFVNTREPYPFDRWAQRNHDRAVPNSWLPLTWDQVEQSVATGLVTFGSHSHTHPNPAELGPDRVEQEAAQSRATLIERLGKAHATAYAYPYGSTRLGHVTAAYRQAVQRAGFTMGFTTDLGVVRQGVDPFGLPRIEAHGGDGAAVIAAKARGVLWPYQLTDALRRAKRAPSHGRLVVC